MFDTTIEPTDNARATKYRIARDGSWLTFADVLDLWEGDAAFRAYFANVLADSPFAAYRWETRALTRTTVEQAFEFVLLDVTAFDSRQTDAQTYRDYFTDDDTDQGIVSFANLRGDATLVVPSPRTGNEAYGHLAAFIRHAPESQVDAFWRVVATTVKQQISDTPLWLSTAGGGVSWLHVRLDARPKYYGYAPYKQVG